MVLGWMVSMVICSSVDYVHIDFDHTDVDCTYDTYGDSAYVDYTCVVYLRGLYLW